MPKYSTGDKWRNNSRKNEGMDPKQKEYPAVDVTGDRSKVRPQAAGPLPRSRCAEARDAVGSVSRPGMTDREAWRAAVHGAAKSQA